MMKKIASLLVMPVVLAGLEARAQDRKPQYELSKLSANADYLFTTILPLEMKALSKRQAARAATPVDEAWMRALVAETLIHDCFRLLDRILRGDPSVAKDADLRKKYKLTVRVEEPGRVDKRFAVAAGDKVLVVRDDKGPMMSIDELLLLREGARVKMERFTAYYRKQLELEKLLRMAEKE